MRREISAAKGRFNGKTGIGIAIPDASSEGKPTSLTGSRYEERPRMQTGVIQQVTGKAHQGWA